MNQWNLFLVSEPLDLCLLSSIILRQWYIKNMWLCQWESRGIWSFLLHFKPIKTHPICNRRMWRPKWTQNHLSSLIHPHVVHMTFFVPPNTKDILKKYRSIFCPYSKAKTTMDRTDYPFELLKRSRSAYVIQT